MSRATSTTDSDTFRRPSHQQSLEWTGERMIPGLGGQIEFEHYHRYLLARELCRGKDVLDVASGEGYGSAFLAQVANSVVGVDVSDVAVAHAQKAYASIPTLSFQCSDALSIALPDHSVDVVISFETIEHLERQDDFIAEVKRILRPDGLFVVSTPDKDVYNGLGEPPNEYHLKELSSGEFTDLVGQHFSNVEIFAQRVIAGSTIWPEDGGKGVSHPLMFERIDADSFLLARKVPAARYLIAFASAAALPELHASLYFDQSFLDGAQSPTAMFAAGLPAVAGNLGGGALNVITMMHLDYVRRLNDADQRIVGLYEMRTEMAASLAAADAHAQHSVRRLEDNAREIAELRERLTTASPAEADLALQAKAYREEAVELRRRLDEFESKKVAAYVETESDPRLDALRNQVRQQATIIDRLNQELREAQLGASSSLRSVGSELLESNISDIVGSDMAGPEGNAAAMRHIAELHAQYEVDRQAALRQVAEIKQQYDQVIARYKKLAAVAGWMPTSVKRLVRRLLVR